MRTFKFSWIALVFVLGCTKGQQSNLEKAAPASPPVVAVEDPYLFLEDREGPEALQWVEPRSDATVKGLTSSPRFSKIADEIRSIRLAKDRLAFPDGKGSYVYNFWLDASHPKGVWRRVEAKNYGASDVKWEELIDVSALAKAEKKNWVWKGANCLGPAYRYCLVHLSNGGEDATVVREYDTVDKVFRKDGFELPRAKHSVDWWSEDELILGTDFGPGSLTLSGYPRVLKRWKRGTPVTDATFLFEGLKTDVSVGAVIEQVGDQTLGVVYRSPSFFEAEYSLITDAGLKTLPLPTDSEIIGGYGTDILVRFRKDWVLGKRTFAGGTLVSFPIAFETNEDWEKQALTVYAPDAQSTLEGATTTKSHLYLSVVRDVRGILMTARKEGGAWKTEDVDLPKDGNVSVVSSDLYTDDLYVQYESFLSPTTLYQGLYSGDALGWKQVAKIPDRFDASDMVMEQNRATSKDGTQVPYFVVRKKTVPLDGTTPTLLTGYGGFEVSLLPRYSAETGKVWVEKGGILVTANIRGGGEFGPKWHEAAILENRPKAYQDFIAVAEDLIRLGYTSSRRLGIRGGSNGGLLVGAVTMMRPDLFQAVVCQVPLLDMIRYQKLPAGDSWTGEYGDPNDPVVGPVLRSYSPYQNIKKGVKYPKMYLWSSLRDDRVHPGHARKMAARLEEYGNPVYYYESKAGGHGGSGDVEQGIADEAMAATYLYQQLVD